MCGIVGWISTEAAHGPPPGEDRLRRATALMAHRGPDGEGTWISPDGRCGLGHRRLSIIDRAGGGQPMATPDGRWRIVFNGEIFNHAEIRRDLEARGERFLTRSDTEVLLRLVALRGAAAVNALRGQFAFAVHDSVSGSLLLARDALGEKPLFTARRDGRVFFASTLDALVEAGDLPPDPDPEAVSHFLAFSYIPAPWTILRAARKLAAGHLLPVTPRGAGSPETWWVPPAPATFRGSFDDAVDALREALGRATVRRLLSDEPQGLFLSSGLDSSAVAVAAARAAPGLRAYVLRHPDPAFDESAGAVAIARHLGLDHEVLDAAPPAPEEMASMLARFGEPFGDSSAAVTAALAGAAAARIKVALTGDGGDELLGGYHRHAYLALVDLLPSAASGIAGALAGGRVRRALSLAAMPEARRYYEMYDSFGGGWRERLLRPAFAAAHGSLPREWLAGIYDGSGGIDPVDRMLRTDLRTHLPDFMNVKVDVSTMSRGIEARSPFQEREVVELGVSLPSAYKVRGFRGKRVLRAVVERALPQHLLSRRKQGFAAPVERALAGPLREEADRLLAPGGPLEALGAVDPGCPRTLLEEHRRGRGNHRIRIWMLLALASWADRRRGAGAP